MEVSGQPCALADLHAGREIRVFIEYKATSRWLPEPFWTLWSRTECLTMPGIGPPTVEPVAIPTELFLLKIDNVIIVSKFYFR
jgi:hypothetical protein